MMRGTWLVVGILLSLCLPAWGQKKAPPTDKEIKTLIDQLVSPNPEPMTTFRPHIDLPAGYDRTKQAKVLDARSKLLELGSPAFPFLIERWNDERYCLTTENGLSGCFTNESVGSICRIIVFVQLQPFGFWQSGGDDPRGKPHRPSYPEHFLESQKAAKAWWEKNKGKTLYQMQLEALDWVIAEEAKRPGDFSAKEQEGLQKIRKDLVKSGKPLPPGGYYAVQVQRSK